MRVLKDDVQSILSSMTNFYRDHLPMDSTMVKLMDVYAQTIGMVRDEFERAYDSTSIEHTPLLRTLPYFKLDVQSGWYDTSVASSLNALVIEEQIKRLKKMGYYVSFQYDLLSGTSSIVYDLTLKTSFLASDSLTHNVDYALREGKLFFLPAYILRQRSATKTLHAFDIFLNDYTLERNFGSKLQVFTGTLLPRYEYREILSGFDQAYSGQLLIKDLKESITKVTGWSTFNLQDYFSPDLAVGKKRLYDRWVLSPSTFIIGVPETIIYDKVRIHVLSYLMDQVKQAQTNFVMFYEINREDELRHLQDEPTATIALKAEDLSPAKQSVVSNIVLSIDDHMFVHEAFNNYDEQILFDSSYDWDTGVEISYDDQQAFDRSRFDQNVIAPSSGVNIRVMTFPEIPRNFTGIRDGQEVMLEVKTNTDGTTMFEVYRSLEENGEYVFVTSQLNNFSDAVTQIIFNESWTNNHYYKVRAVAGTKTSLWTLPINI